MWLQKKEILKTMENEIRVSINFILRSENRDTITVFIFLNNRLVIAFKLHIIVLLCNG